MLRGVAGADPTGAPEVPGGRVRLVVPGLSEATVVGGGCCSFLPAEDALGEALGAWPGVRCVEVNLEGGSIDLDLGPALKDLLTTVADLGYQVEAVQGDGADAQAGL